MHLRVQVSTNLLLFFSWLEHLNTLKWSKREDRRDWDENALIEHIGHHFDFCFGRSDFVRG